MDSSFLEDFKRHVDVMTGDMVQWQAHSSSWWLDRNMCLFSNQSDSTNSVMLLFYRFPVWWCSVWCRLCSDRSAFVLWTDDLRGLFQTTPSHDRMIWSKPSCRATQSVFLRPKSNSILKNLGEGDSGTSQGNLMLSGFLHGRSAPGSESLVSNHQRQISARLS